MSNILDIKMQPNDAGAETVRDYLKKLLQKLWDDGEKFSSKRPFGNSGWEFELYHALVAANAVDGKVDDSCDLIDFDEDAANRLIFEAIESL